MTWHVEGHAAAIMRRDQIRNASLYINATPCKGDDGCEENLRDVLPPGYTLTVYSIRKNGLIRVDIYEGNGHGLEDMA